jgi:hypothetical protein
MAKARKTCAYSSLLGDCFKNTRSMVLRREISEIVQKVEKQHDQWVYFVLFGWSILASIGLYANTTGHNYAAVGWFLLSGLWATAMV